MTDVDAVLFDPDDTLCAFVQSSEALLADSFEAVVFGGHDVPAKPSPEPFDRALDRLDAEPDRTVHVGDSIESDVAGTRAAGVRSVWVADDADAAPDPTPDYTIDGLYDLSTPPW